MKNCSTILFATFLMFAAGPAAAYHICRGSRCALYEAAPGPQFYKIGGAVRARCCAPPPPGWGWYLRQRYRQDNAAPLVIIDELDDVTLVRGR